MPKVRALAPLEDEKGQPIAAGAVFDASDEQVTVWRNAGKVSLVSDEEAAEKAAQSGVYDAVTTREDVGQVNTKDPPPGPQSEEEDEPPKKGKK